MTRLFLPIYQFGEHEKSQSECAFLKYQARNGSKDIDDFVTELGWIESKDKCDPETLRVEPGVSNICKISIISPQFLSNSDFSPPPPQPCLLKILSVSMSYSSALKELSTYESCAQHATTMMTALSKFQKALTERMNLSIPQVVSRVIVFLRTGLLYSELNCFLS